MTLPGGEGGLGGADPEIRHAKPSMSALTVEQGATAPAMAIPYASQFC
jgi:hypothetical protein